MSVRFGVFVPQGWRLDLTEIADPVEQWEAMTAVAKAADAGPWDSIWVYDHFHTTPEPTQNTTFEAWTTTAALARDTRRVNVGQMVGCNGYRNPALYAKMASTVDVLSHGRLYAGLGAGWYEHEWKAYGYPWPSLKDRMGAFAEATEIIYRMWTEDEVVFSGRYHSVDKPINEPKGVRKPHPSLWLGGGGPKVTLRLVARFADAANFGGGEPERITEKADILRRHCDEVGRDYDEIIKSTNINILPIDRGDDPERAMARAHVGDPARWRSGWGLVGTEDEIVAKVESVLAAGADYVNFYIPGLAYDLDLLARAEAVVRRF
ncbi:MULTISPECIES: LLM class F420-dependent oxidoreductase [Thermocrispum]|jgi:F420-dependent oxidoreductase-like protein|uniref:LLM class F420-dependent oxidoreductase n=1 Tax=Thermocrispum agreste TaxID=37925 RepID=A0A2W4JGB7_9PSEU|nr:MULTISPECIES: LLM class F420-dependent oxidoreductase [Thermocrispum]PZM98070.1 MAG: LLM class F420-dependent oxidoreductase [Thermocrispum agreste]